MTDSQLRFWVELAGTLLGLLISVVLAWWQMRREENEIKAHGTISRPRTSWVQVVVFAGACVLPVVAVTLLKDSQTEGTKPVGALVFSVAALGCQAFMATRIHGKVEMGVGLIGGAIMRIGALAYSISKLVK